MLVKGSLANIVVTKVREKVQVIVVRLQQTTPRERLLLGGLVLGAFLYAPLAASDFRTEQADRYADLSSERAAARLALASVQRAQSGLGEKAALEDMRTWGFQASNVEVARVLIEQRLLEEATRAGLSDIRIATEDDLETVGPTRWINAELTAELRWSGTFAFLESLTAWPEGFRVRGFQYDLPVIRPNQQQVGTFQNSDPGDLRMTLSFPVTIEAVP